MAVTGAVVLLGSSTGFTAQAASPAAHVHLLLVVPEESRRLPKPASPEGAVRAAGITVTWRPSTNASVLGYELRLTVSGRSVDSQVLSRHTSRYSWPGVTLTAGDSVQLADVAASGRGLWSSQLLSTSAAAPDQPAPPVAVNSGGSGGGQLTVSWTGPATHGAAVTGYDLAEYDNGALLNHMSATATITSAGMATTNGHVYTFTVAAQSAAGTSAVSQRSAPVTSYGAAGQIANVVATAGDRSVTLACATPSDGGSPISRYEAQSYGTSPFSLTGTGAVVGSLTNGTAYAYQVRACNAYAVCGPWSAVSNSVVPHGAPGAPAAALALSGSSGLLFTWGDAVANGCPMAGYVVTVDGVPAHTAAGAGSFEKDFGFSERHTFAVTAADTCGGRSASNTATATTAADPNAPSVSLSVGPITEGRPGCTTGPCWWFVIQLTRFPPSAPERYACFTSTQPQPFYQGTIVTDADGSATLGQGGCYAGHVPGHVWVEVGGVSSNEMAWP